MACTLLEREKSGSRCSALERNRQVTLRRITTGLCDGLDYFSSACTICSYVDAQTTKFGVVTLDRLARFFFFSLCVSLQSSHRTARRARKGALTEINVSPHQRLCLAMPAHGFVCNQSIISWLLGPDVA
jgi:hypothetical protein